MRTFNKVILIALVAIMALGLAGCKAAATTAGPTTAGPATTESSSAAPVTIHILTQDQAGLKPAEIDQIARDFEAANPDIKVVMEYVSYDAIHDKVVTAMAATPPGYDASMLDVIWPDEFIKAGYLADVTSRITPDMKNNMFEASWNGVTRNGKIYGLPWLMDVKYFIYNKSMLDQAGITTPPTTWEELVTQAQTLKDKGIVEFPIMWSWNQKEGVVCDFTVLLYGNGGTFLDANGKPAFNNEKGVQALTWMKSTLDAGLTNPSSISSDENAVRDTFVGGNAAFAVNWLYEYTDSNNKDLSKVVGQAAFAPMPVFKAGADAGIKSSSVDGSSAFGIMATSPNIEQTWKFLTYLSSYDVQMKFSAEMLPVWKNAYTGDNLTKLEGATPTNPITVPAFLAQFPYANERPTVAYYNEASAALQLAIQEALTGVKTPQQALDDAAAKWVSLAGQ